MQEEKLFLTRLRDGVLLYLFFNALIVLAAPEVPVGPSKSKAVVAFEPSKANSSSVNKKPVSSPQLKNDKSLTKSPSYTSKPIAWTWDKPYVPSKEISEIEIRANEGDQRAQAEMALRYRTGEGILQNLKSALRACESNAHPIAQFNFSRMLFYGLEVEKDTNRADKLLREAYEPLRLLSDDGDSLATALIAIYFKEGFGGISKDLVEAEKLFRKSHASGCVFGTCLLGALLVEMGESKHQEGRTLLRLAAEQGSSLALTVLTNETIDNEIKRWKPGEPKEQTVSDLNLLASLGDEEALNLLRSSLIQEKYRDYNRAFKVLEALSAKTPESERYELNAFYAVHYLNGWGVSKNYQLGFKLALEGAMRGNWSCCDLLRYAYSKGYGTPKNYTNAYAWGLLAAGKGKTKDGALHWYEVNLPPQQITEAQKLAQSLNTEIERNQLQGSDGNNSSESVRNKSSSSGTGFFLSENGYIATNFHVVAGAKKILVRTANGEMGAVIVLSDQINDVAVIKAPVLGKPLSIGDVPTAVAGTPVYTVGFPNPVVQGFEPKLTKGDINSTTGLKDDPRMFQISVPVQPGNSGGPLLNERGAVIGLITAQLNSVNALVTSGVLPQNVNYALKANYLKPLIESNKELREAVDGSKSKREEVRSMESAMESVLLILVEK